MQIIECAFTRRRRSGALRVLGALVAAFCARPIAAQPDPAKATTMEELRQVRKQLAHRKRRILFNNDGCDVTYYCKESAPEGLLRVRTTPLLGTQVDTIIYNTSSSFGLFRHRTKIGQIFTCKAKSFKTTKPRISSARARTRWRSW